MIKSAALIAATILISGCAHQDPWTERDTAMFAAVVGVVAADMYSTNNIRSAPHIEENGPIARQVLGSQPQSSETAAYGLGLLAVYYTVGRALPERWRPWWFGFNMVDHGSALINNCKLDLC